MSLNTTLKFGLSYYQRYTAPLRVATQPLSNAVASRPFSQTPRLPDNTIMLKVERSEAERKPKTKLTPEESRKWKNHEMTYFSGVLEPNPNPTPIYFTPVPRSEEQQKIAFIIRLAEHYPEVKDALQAFLRNSVLQGWSAGLEKSPTAARQFLIYVILDLSYWRKRIEILKEQISGLTEGSSAKDQKKERLLKDEELALEWKLTTCHAVAKLVFPNCTDEQLDAKIERLFDRYKNEKVIEKSVQSLAEWAVDKGHLHSVVKSLACLWGWTHKGVEHYNHPDLPNFGVYFEEMSAKNIMCNIVCENNCPHPCKTPRHKKVYNPILDNDGRALPTQKVVELDEDLLFTAKEYFKPGEMDTDHTFRDLFLEGFKIEMELMNAARELEKTFDEKDFEPNTAQKKQ